MKKQIIINVPESVDENLIRDVVNVIVKYKEIRKEKKADLIEKFLEVLRELPEARKFDWKDMKKRYYEGKLHS